MTTYAITNLGLKAPNRRQRNRPVTVKDETIGVGFYPLQISLIVIFEEFDAPFCRPSSLVGRLHLQLDRRLRCGRSLSVHHTDLRGHFARHIPERLGLR